MGVFSNLNWLRRELLDGSPRRNIARLGRWLHRKFQRNESGAAEGSNQVLDAIVASPLLPKYLLHATSQLKAVVFLGPSAISSVVLAGIAARGGRAGQCEF